MRLLEEDSRVGSKSHTCPCSLSLWGPYTGQLLQTLQFLSEVWGAYSPGSYFTWNEAESNLIIESVLKHLKMRYLLRHTYTHMRLFLMCARTATFQQYRQAVKNEQQQERRSQDCGITAQTVH